MPTLGAVRILFYGALLSTAISVNAHENGNYLRALQESLVSWPASDFTIHDPLPEKFRGVRVRYRENDHGARSHVLCGEFLPADAAKASWTPFATIKTGPYEQWIGEQAKVLCEHALHVSADNGLSSVLEAQMSRIAATPGQP